MRRSFEWSSRRMRCRQPAQRYLSGTPANFSNLDQVLTGVNPIQMMWGWANSAAMKVVYPQFDQSDFLAGAKQSFEHLNDLVYVGELDSLKPLVSQDIFEQFSDLHRARKELAEWAADNDDVDSDSSDVIMATKTMCWELEKFLHCQILSIGIAMSAGKTVGVGGGVSGFRSPNSTSSPLSGSTTEQMALHGSPAKLVIHVHFTTLERRTLLNDDGSEYQAPSTEVKNHTWAFQRDFSFLSAPENPDRAAPASYWTVTAI